VAEDFDKAHHGEPGRLRHGAHSGSAHLGAGAAEKDGAFQPARQRAHDAGGVAVARRLSGGNQDLHGHTSVPWLARPAKERQFRPSAILK